MRCAGNIVLGDQSDLRASRNLRLLWCACHLKLQRAITDVPYVYSLYAKPFTKSRHKKRISSASRRIEYATTPDMIEDR